MIKTVLEAYRIDEESYKPYISPLNTAPLFGEGEKQSYLQLGDVTETITYPVLDDASFDKDYDSISGSASVKLGYRNIDLKYLYKGVKVCIKTTVDDESLEYLGFISNNTYDIDTISLDIAGYEVLLDEEWQCDYKQQLRSVILTELIKEAGMEPHVDVTGLTDDIMDYTSINQSSNNNGEAKTGDDCSPTSELCVAKGRPHGNCGSHENWDEEAKNGIAKEDSAYYGWARSFKSDKEMLLGLRHLFTYSQYWDNRDNCASVTFDDNGFSANCGDAARLVKACCDSRGLPCVCIHGSPYEGTGHYWNVIKINGDWLSFDLCYQVTSQGDQGGTNESDIFD